MTVNTKKVLSVILGGGAGTRLFPLTKDRAKPAVPLAGKYRLVDIPISNCINSDLRNIYVLTQFQSASMHQHISGSYKFDPFTGGFVEILAAQQTFSDTSWWHGTADAVRKNLMHFLTHAPDYILILSGDQLYRMDFRQILQQHQDTGAKITVATIPVIRKDASSLGIMQMEADRRIHRFVEKPKEASVLDVAHASLDCYAPLGIVGRRASCSWHPWASTCSTGRAWCSLLDNDLSDFGKHIIPNAIESQRVFSYVFQGYWEDIGTIRAFFDAHLDLAEELPRFNFFDMAAPIFSRPRWLPGSKINGGTFDHAVISDGCIINRAVIAHSIVGLRSSFIGTAPNRVIMMGSDYYESLDSILETRDRQTAHWRGHQLPHREHHRGQERADRRQRGDLTRGQGRERRPPELLHPRRHCDHSQERRNPLRNHHLSDCRRPFTPVRPPEAAGPTLLPPEAKCFLLGRTAVVAGDQHVDGRDDEQGEECADEHAAHQDQTDGVSGGGAGAGDQGQGKVAGDGGGGGHQDRPQPDHGRFADRLELGVSLELQLVGKFDDQDAVLGDQPHQGHQADLGVDVEGGGPAVGPEWHVRDRASSGR